MNILRLEAKLDRSKTLYKRYTKQHESRITPTRKHVNNNRESPRWKRPEGRSVEPGFRAGGLPETADRQQGKVANAIAHKIRIGLISAFYS